MAVFFLCGLPLILLIVLSHCISSVQGYSYAYSFFAHVVQRRGGGGQRGSTARHATTSLPVKRSSQAVPVPSSPSHSSPALQDPSEKMPTDHGLIQRYLDVSISPNRLTNKALLIAINALPGSEVKALVDEVLVRLQSPLYRPERFFLSTLLNACVQHRLMYECLDLFETMRDRFVPDLFGLSRAVRAASSTRPWNYTLSLLREAEELHEDRKEIETVAQHALTNLRRLPTNRKNIFAYAMEVFEWMLEKGIHISDKTVNTLLAVASKHGNATDCSQVLLMCQDRGFRPNIITFNTLLDRAAQEGNSEKCDELMSYMQSLGLKPDQVTFNTLLKLCVHTASTQQATAVLKSMHEAGLSPCDNTRRLLVQIAEARNSSALSAKLVLSSHEELSPHTFAVAIRASQDPDRAMRLLSKAEQAKRVDQVVYVATAQVLSQHGRYLDALSLLDQLEAHNYQLHPYTISFMIRLYFESYQQFRSSETGLRQLVHLLNRLHCSDLLTAAVAQKIVKELVDLREVSLVCRLYATYFHATTISRPLFRKIFKQLGEFGRNRTVSSLSGPTVCFVDHLSSNHGDADVTMLPTDPYERLSAITADALAFLRVYAEGSSLQKSYLTTDILNIMLRLCGDANHMESVKKVFSMFKTSGLRPKTFTIAEMVRIARRNNDMLLLLDIMRWAAMYTVDQLFIPFPVISDALAGLYASGSTSLCLEAYQALYAAGRLSHWTQKDGQEVVVDLHTFNRGLAHAALSTVLEEIRSDPALASATSLVVIAGQSLSHGAGTQPFCLIEEVQNQLLEEFFPPIPSSTAPGNAGRVRINLRDLRDSQAHSQLDSPI